MRSRSTPSAALGMIRELAAVQRLSDSLEATAPMAVVAAGGVAAIVRTYGMPSGAGFWTASGLPDELWEAMARESQESSRS